MIVRQNSVRLLWMPCMKLHLEKPERRGGFTLLELLMVVAIIGILMSMSIVVMLGFIDQAEEEATSTTVQKLARLIEQRTEAFDRAFVGARKQNAINGMRALLADPNVDGNQDDGIFGVYDAAVTMLAKKAAFRFEMPQRFAERYLFEGVAMIVPGLPNSMYIAIAAP